MASYHFALKGDLQVTVKTSTGSGPRFTAQVVDGAGDVIGKGADYTEPGAIGLAVLAARDAFRTCNGCGMTFYRDELEKDIAGLWYCGDCAWDRTIPDRGQP
jgi:hypothetical protein